MKSKGGERFGDRSRWSTRRRARGCAAPPRRGSPRHPRLRGLEVRFDVVAVRAGGSARIAPRAAGVLAAARRTGRGRGADPGRALRGHRPRPLVVGARAARARADEARPPAAPVPRQVHPAARRGAARRHVPAGGRVLDPFAGSGTTLVQALESGLDATGVDIAAFNCLLMRVKTARYNPFVLERELRDALAPLRAGRRARPAGRHAVRARLVRAAGGRPSCCASARSSTTTSTPTSCASCSRARRARRGARRTSTSTSRARRSASRTGATSTSASAGRSSERAALPAPLHARHARAAQGVRARARRAGARPTCCTATRASSTSAAAFDGVVTSPPYPGLIDYHEQHRYAYELLGLDDLRELELGAARGADARRSPRTSTGSPRCSANVRRAAAAGRAGRDRRQRPPRALPGDPRARRAAARGALPAAREPPHRPSRRRVLRRRARRAARCSVATFGTEPCTDTCTGCRLAWTTCSRAPSHMPSSASSPPRRGRGAPPAAACRRSRSSGSPTARARRRRSASAAASPPPSSSGRCGGSRSTSRRPSCARRARGSTCRSRWRCSPRRGRCRPRRSAGTPRSASSRWTGGCGRSPGALAAAEGARRDGLARLVCAAESGAEVALAGIEPGAGRHLAEAVAYLRGEREPPARELAPRDDARSRAAPDLADVRGQERARRALEIAAAGGHNLLLGGPPGTGKTMLARRLPGILPPLDDDEALEVTRIHSVAGLLAAGPAADPRRRRFGRRTTRRRRRRSSAAARRRGRARRASRIAACCSSTSCPSSRAPVLEALRQPLEDGVDRGRARRRASVVFPARFQLVGDDEPVPVRRARRPGGRVLVLAAAARRVPGQALARAARPLRPRRHGAAAARATSSAAPPGEASDAVRERVVAAREPAARHEPLRRSRGGERAADARGRAAAAVRPRARAGRAGRANDRGARRRRDGRRRACRRGALVPVADGARTRVSELALAAFAAETRRARRRASRATRRFERFRAGFDEAAYRAALAARGLRVRSARGEPAFPPLLAAIHDPPPGLFLRGAGATEVLAQPRGRDRRRAGVLVVRRAGRALARRASSRRPASSSSRPRARHRRRGAPRRARGGRRARSPCSAAASTATTRALTRELARAHRRARARRLGVRAGRRAGAVAVPGPQPDHRRARARDGRRRGARAERRADHRRLRARGGARGARRARRDHLGALGGHERAAAPRRDAASPAPATCSRRSGIEPAPRGRRARRERAAAVLAALAAARRRRRRARRARPGLDAAAVAAALAELELLGARRRGRRACYREVMPPD